MASVEILNTSESSNSLTVDYVAQNFTANPDSFTVVGTIDGSKRKEEFHSLGSFREKQDSFTWTFNFSSDTQVEVCVEVE